MPADVVLITLMASKKIFQLKKNHQYLERSKVLSEVLSKVLIVLGDSMLKSVNGWEMSRKATNCKFSVKSLSGAKIKDMND